MRKLLTALFFTFFISCIAQNNETMLSDADYAIKQDSIDSLVRVTRRFNYYVNVQTNLLFQQILNFNTSIGNPNPYMFNFSTNDKRSGRGFIVGTGLGASNNFTNDGVVEITDERINLAARLGYERKLYQWRKFVPIYGIELGFGYNEQRLKTKLIQTISNSETNTKTTKLFFGPALRGGIHYKITNDVVIGTEFYFNFQLSVNKSVTVTNNPANPLTNQQSTKTSLPVNVGFQVPTAIFLGYRF